MSAAKPDLCVSVTASQASIARGQTAYYVVDVWAKSGSVGKVALKLSDSPTSQPDEFYLGCGSGNGASTCDLGTVGSGSTPVQVEAEIPVASNATSVSSVTLTAKASGNYVKTEPTAAGQVSVTAATSSSLGDGSTLSGGTSTLPTGDTSLPSLNSQGSSYLSNGGSASGLFPTIDPSSSPSTGASTTGKTNSGRALSAEPAADTTALSLGTPMIAAQAAGLGALVLACILAVTRLSVRRRAPQDK